MASQHLFRLRMTVVALVFGCAVGLGSATSAPKSPHEWLPVERCAPVRAAPTIDGRLDDECWRAAVGTSDFVTTLGKPTKLRTQAHVAHDGDNLYVAFECTDSQPQSLVKEHTQRDSDVYLDDCVEVFVDANLDFKTYYHFLVNAGNVQRDESGDVTGTPRYDPSWDARWESAVSIGDNGWRVEIRIPLEQLGIQLEQDEVIGINLCRKAARAEELSCWVPTNGGFHNPHRHATIVLARQESAPALSVEPTSVGTLRPDEDALFTARVENRSGHTVKLIGEARVGSNQGLWWNHEAWTALRPGESAEGALGYRAEGTGPTNLCILVREVDGGEVVYVGNVAFTVPMLLAEKFGARLPSPPECQVWWAESTYKIAPDRGVPAKPGEAVRVAAAGNEYESFQIVLRPRREMKNVHIAVSPLRSGRRSIGARNVRLFQVEWVNVERPSDSFGSPGPYPDPLVPITGPIDVPSDRNTVLWAQLRVPRGTPAGEYAGRVTIAPEDGQAFAVPIQLHVFDFSLTDETHTRTAYGLRPDWTFLGLTDLTQREEVFEKYLQAFREHRLSPYDPFMFSPLQYELHGPEWRVRTAGLELTCNKFSSRYFSIAYKGQVLGDLTNTMTQFEKEGVGWQGTGRGWPGIDHLKEVKLLERTPQRCVFEITGEKTGSGAASRRYEITFRFAIAAGHPAFAARMIRFKNTDSIRYQMHGYFYILRPEGEGAQKAKGDGYGAWLLPGGVALGAVSVPSEAGFDMAPINVPKSIWLEPGQEIEGFGPTMFFFAGEASSAEEVQALVAELKEAVGDGGLEALQPVRGRTLRLRAREGVRITHDFDAFDRAARKYFDRWKFNGFRYRAMPGSLAGHQRFTREYNRLHAKIYGPIIVHLEENGWLDEAYAYWFDEPAEEEYSYVVSGMELLGQNCPGLTRLLTEQVEDPLIGHVDLWVPVLSRYDEERCQARQKAGERVWWYVCTGPRAPYPNDFIDHPAINHRIRFWMMEKYGVTGSLYWHTSYWYGQDRKLRNPWESTASISPTGGFWGNGDGMLLYPACRQPSDEPVLEGPVITQRIEVLRDGLEDREYLWTLKQLFVRAMFLSGITRGDRREELDRLFAEAVEALCAKDRLVTSLTEYSKDPQELLRERSRIAEAIENLRRAGITLDRPIPARVDIVEPWGSVKGTFRIRPPDGS